MGCVLFICAQEAAVQDAILLAEHFAVLVVAGKQAVAFDLSNDLVGGPATELPGSFVVENNGPVCCEHQEG